MTQQSLQNLFRAIGCLALGFVVGGCPAESPAATEPGPTDKPDGSTSDGGPVTQPDGGGVSPFPLACSAAKNASDSHCAAPGAVKPGSIGTGPTITGSTFPELEGGFVDGNRIIAAVKYDTAVGAIMAVDLTTGNRTIVSGTYNDPATGKVVTGTGPDLGGAMDVQRGASGWYAVSAKGVFKIDPANGNRTLVWDAAAPAQRCKVGTVEVTPRTDGLAVDTTDKVYLTLSNNPSKSGVGVVGVLDGKCEMVSVTGGSVDRGGGLSIAEAEFHGLRFSAGALWAVEYTSESLFRFALPGGDRTRVSSSMASHVVGEGELPVGDGWLGFTADNQVWTTRYFNTGKQLILTPINLATGNRGPFNLADGPVGKGNATNPPIWIHPTSPWLVVGLNNAFVLYDPTTGESYTLSR
jgi:hypothetical protein